MTYQPRFILYARAHGKRPEHAPAGHHYINWIRQRWAQWDALTGHQGPHTKADHAAFDAWLEGWVGGLQAATEHGVQGEMFG